MSRWEAPLLSARGPIGVTMMGPFVKHEVVDGQDETVSDGEVTT